MSFIPRRRTFRPDFLTVETQDLIRKLAEIFYSWIHIQLFVHEIVNDLSRERHSIGGRHWLEGDVLWVEAEFRIFDIVVAKFRTSEFNLYSSRRDL